jgi:hypothetical protein
MDTPRTSTDSRLGRRAWMLSSAAGAAALMLPASVLAKPVFAEVWKDPNCGCCKDWVTHLQAAGFQVKVNDIGNDVVRGRLGVDRKYGSCHTALISGYAIEGHVPARDIQRLLRERPNVVGLAVAGMPVGSPGMDGSIYGTRKDSYDVLLLAKDGSATVFQHYQGSKS